MITLPHALTPEHVTLDLAATSLDEAINHVAGLLRHEARVRDWQEFHTVLQKHAPCRVADGGVGICIPHARTSAVEELVMSAARLRHDLPCAELNAPIRYIFCIGVPQAMAADYLRLVGALMRIFKDPETEKALRAATSRQDFVDELGRFEIKL